MKMLSGISVKGKKIPKAFANMKVFPVFVGQDLSGVDLSNLDLRGGNFFRVDLTGADLRGTKLPYANLHGAILVGCQFDNKTDLSNANLCGAQLDNATGFAAAKCLKANLKDASLKGAATIDDLKNPECFDEANIAGVAF